MFLSLLILWFVLCASSSVVTCLKIMQIYYCILQEWQHCSEVSHFTSVLNILPLVCKRRRGGKYWFKRSINQHIATMLKSIKPLNFFFLFFFFPKDDCISFLFLESVDHNSLCLILSKCYVRTSLWLLKWSIFFFNTANSSFHSLETMLFNRFSCLVTLFVATSIWSLLQWIEPVLCVAEATTEMRI